MKEGCWFLYLIFFGWILEDKIRELSKRVSLYDNNLRLGLFENWVLVEGRSKELGFSLDSYIHSIEAHKCYNLIIVQMQFNNQASLHIILAIIGMAASRSDNWVKLTWLATDPILGKALHETGFKVWDIWRKEVIIRERPFGLLWKTNIILYPIFISFCSLLVRVLFSESKGPGFKSQEWDWWDESETSLVSKSN